MRNCLFARFCPFCSMSSHKTGTGKKGSSKCNGAREVADRTKSSLFSRNVGLLAVRSSYKQRQSSCKRQRAEKCLHRHIER